MLPDKPYSRGRELFEKLLSQKVVLKGLVREDMMSHPNQSAPGFGWLSGDDFAKQASSSGMAGLPAKKIHVDTDVQPGVSEQTCGQLYGDQITAAVSQEPMLRCPNCGEPASALANGQQLYTRDIKETGGKTHKGSLPPCPVPGLDIPQILYTVEPCGCKVSQEWAGSFSGEMQSRLLGNKPKAIMPMSEATRAARLAKLEQQLTKLYNAQSLAGDTETKKDVDYWIIVVIDQIQRLCPGTHNKAAPKALDPEVANWADQHNLQTPYKGILAGSPVFMDKEGKYTTQGTGKPVGVVTGGFGVEGGGYGSGYKPPPGFKGSGIEVDSLVCSYTLLPNFPAFAVKWSDGTQQNYNGMGEAKCHENALSKSVSSNERNRGKALARTLPKIDAALVAVRAKVISDTALAKTMKEADQKLATTLAMAQSGIINGLFKSAFGFDPPAVKFEQEMQQQPPKPVAKIPPKLQTLPVETGEKINFFGALPEEKEAYVKSLKKIVANKPTEYPTNLLQAVMNYFETDKGFMTSLVRQEVLHGQCDTVSLLHHCAAIVKDIKRYMNGEVTELQSCTRLLLQGFVNYAQPTEEQLAKAQKPAEPVPAPAAPESQRTNRHHKRKRTIRRVEED